MVTWKDFAAAAPDLAQAGRALLNQFGVGLAFLATVRRDGAPRLHPVCPVLSGDRLSVLVTLASPKHGDLLRDGRYALQTFPEPKPGSAEFYLAGTSAPDRRSGRARADPEGRQAHGARVGDRLRAVDRAGHAHAAGNTR